MQDERFHFGEWLRGKILTLGVYPSAFAQIIGACPTHVHAMIDARSTRFVPGDAERLARELGIAPAEISNAAERAWREWEADRYPKLLTKRSSIFREPIWKTPLERPPAEISITFESMPHAWV